MDVMVTKGQPQDYEDIIDFGNMVFQEDFKELLPKLYDGRPDMACHHHLVKEDGRIKALVGSFPIGLSVAGQRLRVRGIGTVSVHPYARSRGYMKVLMKNAVKEAQDEGAAMMVLSGQRQRYEYFGFTTCSTEIRFSLNPSVRRHLRSISTDGIRLLPLAENKEYLRDCCQLLEAQPLHGIRPGADFCDITQSWRNTAYVILLDGAFLGYCAIQNGKVVHEIFLREYSPSANVMMKLCEMLNVSFAVTAMPHQTELIHTLNQFCEGQSLFTGPMFNVLDYPAVIRAYLSLKGQRVRLEDGRLVIQVLDKGRYAIQIRGGQVDVQETTDEPQVSLPHLEMMNYLFSPLGQMGGGEKTTAEKSWLPIPLYFLECDNV